MSGSAPRVLVVGGVAAGMSAASQAKRRLPGAEVVVFEKGSYISYGACGLPYNIQDPQRPLHDLVVLTAERALAERGIKVWLRHEVVAIELDTGHIMVRDLEEGKERREPFDALVVAAGARPVRLPLPGFDLPGVEVLRDLSDGGRVKELVDRDPQHAVLVGAGYIGMEMAHVLTSRGVAVTVLEKQGQILPGWHQETVTAVTQELEGHGVVVLTETEVSGAEPGDDGRVAAVLSNHGRHPADLVIQAVGIRPNSELAAAAGLRLGETGAVWASQQQQTSHPQVWTAGDCAEAYHRVLRRNDWIPLGTTANKQGRVAGANAVGARERFPGVVGTAGFVVFGLEVARSGLGVEQAATEGFDPVSVTVRQRSRAHAFPGGGPIQVTLVADAPSGLLLGGELVGPEGAALRVNVVATALATHMTVADLQGLDLAYAPPFAPVWDPLLVAANQLAKKTGRTP